MVCVANVRAENNLTRYLLMVKQRNYGTLLQFFLPFAKRLLQRIRGDVSDFQRVFFFLHIKGYGPAWCISSVLYSRDIPFWSGTLNMWRFFQSKHRGSHILSSWMVHGGCVFVTGIHLSRAWMSGSFESMWWNACVDGLDLSLYPHLKEFLGNGVRTHVNSKGKNPLYQRLRGC